MTLLDRARSLLRRRPEGTAGQLDQERETAVSLQLMASAASAGAEMTDEQAIFLSQSKAGMNARIAYLRGPDVPKPLSLAQERELTMIERELARLEGRDEPKPTLVARAKSWAPARFLGGVGGIQIWQILAGACVVLLAGLGVQTARLENAKHNEAEARRVATSNARAAEEWEERAELYQQAVTDAREAARQSAADLERERERRARAAAAERRRQREIQNVLANSPEPPSWSLRDTGADPSQ